MRQLTRDERRKLAEADAIRRRVRQAARKARPRPAKPDRGRERDPGFLAYLRRQPCEAAHLGGCKGPIEAAHVRYSDASRGVVNPGMGRKNHDRHCLPLCAHHHRNVQHKMNERRFWQMVEKDPYVVAERHYEAYTGDDQ